MRSLEGTPLRQRIRFSLSDESGRLRFTRFEIVDSHSCEDFAKSLRAYVLDRPLNEIDLDHVKSLSCAGHEDCVRETVEVIREYRALFSGDGDTQGAKPEE